MANLIIPKHFFAFFVSLFVVVGMMETAELIRPLLW